MLPVWLALRIPAVCTKKVKVWNAPVSWCGLSGGDSVMGDSPVMTPL
jgi:hypothetical protein